MFTTLSPDQESRDIIMISPISSQSANWCMRNGVKNDGRKIICVSSYSHMRGYQFPHVEMILLGVDKHRLDSHQQFQYFYEVYLARTAQTVRESIGEKLRNIEVAIERGEHDHRDSLPVTSEYITSMIAYLKVVDEAVSEWERNQLEHKLAHKTRMRSNLEFRLTKISQIEAT